MPSGYTGKILRVNLTTGEIATEQHDDRFYRTYVGGRGVIAYYLLNETKRGVDALGPENKLIFAPGVITGAAVAGCGRNSVGAKNLLRRDHQVARKLVWAATGVDDRQQVPEPGWAEATLRTHFRGAGHRRPQV